MTVALAPDSDRSATAGAVETALAALIARVPRPATLVVMGGATLMGMPAGALLGGQWDGLPGSRNPVASAMSAASDAFLTRRGEIF